jgi:hypothetical protein
MANDFFSLLKTKEDFCSWMYSRIVTLEMELNHDFYIFIPASVAKELSRIESFKDERTRHMIKEMQ